MPALAGIVLLFGDVVFLGVGVGAGLIVPPLPWGEAIEADGVADDKRRSAMAASAKASVKELLFKAASFLIAYPKV